jgi:hypothetical protein
MEIRLNIDDDYINNLKKALGIKTASQITSDALSLLAWAVDQKKNGREIISASGDGQAYRLLMPSLEMVKEDPAHYGEKK